MAPSVKVSGSWKAITAAFVKVGGAWKSVSAMSVKVGGAWKDVPLSVDPVTASSDWGSDSLSVPATITSGPRTMTVPSGNPGSLDLGLSGDYDGTPQYRINSGTWTTFVNGTDVTVANGDALTFRCLNMATPTAMVVVVTDNTTAAAVGGWTGTGL